MTGVRKTTDRAAKWMGYIARALTVIWAAELTLMAAFAACFLGSVGHEVEGGWAAEFPWGTVAGLFLVLSGWVSVAIPWRWRREGAGGVVLLLEGLLVFIWTLLMYRGYPEAMVFAPIVALPPVVAGSLFLASWWRSRRAGSPEKST